MHAPLGVDALLVGDSPDSWAAAGFSMNDATVEIGGVSIECGDDGSAPRWRLWNDGDGAPDDVDGLTTEMAAEPHIPGLTEHPNHVVGIDHIVLASPDLDRTTEAFADLGVECRRIRDVPGSQPAMQQRFFRLGPVILELVGAPDRTGDGPLSIWGLALNVDDMSAATSHLGSACGAPKDAVQPGRSIATMRTRDLGISLPIALMTTPNTRP